MMMVAVVDGGGVDGWLWLMCGVWGRCWCWWWCDGIDRGGIGCGGGGIGRDGGGVRGGAGVVDTEYFSEKELKKGLEIRDG